MRGPGSKELGASYAKLSKKNKPKPKSSAWWEEDDMTIDLQPVEESSKVEPDVPPSLKIRTFPYFREMVTEKVQMEERKESVVLSLSECVSNCMSRAMLEDLSRELTVYKGPWSYLRERFMRYPLWFSRNQMASSPPDETKLNHIKACIELALHLCESHYILDVDGLWNYNLPSASDLTVYSHTEGLSFIDLTSSKLSSDKMSNLVASCKEVFLKGVREFNCTLLQFEGVKSGVSLEIAQKNAPTAWNDVPEEACLIVNKCLRGATKEELAELSKVLEGALSPSLVRLLPNQQTNSNSIDPLKRYLPEVIKAITEEYIIEESEVPEFLLSSARGDGVNPIEVHQVIYNSLEEDLREEEFWSCGLEGVLCKDRLRKLNFAPPATCLNNPIRQHPSLETVDYMLWVSVKADELNYNWKSGDPTEYVFNSIGKVTPLLGFDKVKARFDEPQFLSMRFPNSVVAYVRFNPFEDKGLFGEPGWKTPKHFQMLFNPNYSSCPNFAKFLARKDPTYEIRPEAKYVNPVLKSDETSSYISKLTKASIPSPCELLRQALVYRSTRNKVNMVFKEKGPANMKEVLQATTIREGSILINMADSMSSSVRGLFPFLNSKHLPNSYCLMDSADYGMCTLWYLPGSYPNFSSTWRRVFSVSEVLDEDLIEPSNLLGYSSIGLVRSNTLPVRLSLKGDNVSVATERCPEYVAASMRVGPLSYNAEGNVSTQCKLYASSFHSVDKMHVEWEAELPYRLLNRVSSLTEYRLKLYTDMMRSEEDLLGDLEEINLNLLTFLPNRQQFSVVCTAWRYLHQALGSLDCDPNSTLKKLKGISVKSHIENHYLLRMISVYKVSLLARLMRGINFIRATNREVFVSAPDLLYASNSASLNVSSYSSSNLLNTSKTWRTSSEAACVQAAWDQFEDLELVRKNETEFWFGMPMGTFRRMLTMSSFDIKTLIAFLVQESAQLQAYTLSLINHHTPRNLCSNFWFEVLVHVDLRVEKGTFSMSSTLGGKGIREFLTMRGSTISTSLESYDSNPAVRKATAFLVLIARLATNDPSIKEPEKCSDLEQDGHLPPIDQLSLARKLMDTPYVKLIEPICQFSEKDAPGKDREISTLNIEFGMTCLLCEKVVQPYSSSIPEDLVTHSAKEMSIYQSVLQMERKRESNEDYEVLYVNQDKSKYGPNRKVSSMLLTAAILSEDEETFELFSMALKMSSRKLVSYPHELIKHSLGLSKPVLETINSMARMVRKPLATEDTMPVPRGTTAKIMRRIFDQFRVGNEYGPRGSTWVQVREGMPGQGIFTTLSSISHAAAQRFFSKFALKHLGWEWSSRVTSDDSMTMILHRVSDSIVVHNGVKTLIAGLTYQMGLIENKAKMTITARRPEMNTFYMLKGEPICAVWKFSAAYTSLNASGNLGEDLLACVSKASDLYRIGGSYFSSCYLASSLVVMTLDAYRFWGVYLADPRDDDKVKASSQLWRSPVELFGIPSLDPISPIMSPVGTRVVSAMDTSVARRDLELYVQMVLDSVLLSSKVEQDSGSKDPYGNIAVDGFRVMKLNDGDIKVPLRKLPPTVNGLIGSLFRRKSEIKVSKELGEIALKYPKITSSRGWQIRRLLEAVRPSFDVPMKRGHSQRGVMQIYREIAHSPNYKFLKVSPNSFFPRELLGTSISLNDLKVLLSNPSSLKTMSENFSRKLNEGRSTDLSLSSLEELLLKTTSTCVKISDIVKVSMLRPHQVKFGYDESKADLALGRRVFKRLVRLNFSPKEAIHINLDNIRVQLLSRYISSKPIYMAEYRGLPVEPMGDMDEFEAWEQAEVTLERIKSLIPSSQILYSDTIASGHSKENDVIDWIRCNALVDHQFNLTDRLLGDASLKMADLGASTKVRNSGAMISHTYLYGPAIKEKRYIMELEPTMNSYNVKTEISTIAPPWVFGLGQDVLYELAESGQALRPTIALFNEIIINCPVGLWVGSPSHRIKVHFCRKCSSDEAFFVVVSTTTVDVNVKGYKHSLIFFSELGVTSLKDHSRAMQEFFNWAEAIKAGSTMSDFPIEQGEDIYEVVFLGPSDESQVVVNVMDFLVSFRETNVMIPLGRMVDIGEWDKDDHLIMISSSNVPKLRNASPTLRDLPKVSMNRISIEHQREWLAYFELLFKGYSREDYPPRMRQLLLELAASFLVSGRVVQLRQKAVYTSLELEEVPDGNKLVSRALTYHSLSRLFDPELYPLITGFYKLWAEVKGASYKAELNYESLQNGVGEQEQVELMSVRFIPEDWDEGARVVGESTNHIDGLLNAFRGLAEAARTLGTAETVVVEMDRIEDSKDPMSMLPMDAELEEVLRIMEQEGTDKITNVE